MSFLLQAEALRPYREDGSVFEHGLSLDIDNASLTCLVGPNGSGKTAYLRALAGVDPAAGTLRILDSEIAGLDTEAWRKLRCKAAFISEGAPLVSVFSGLSNVTLPALYHQLGTHEDIERRALELLEFLHYPGQHDVLPAYLNQHQRLILAIARSLILSPELIFLDEPFHMTDEDCRRRESEIYVRLARERGLAVLVSTHNLGFVRRHAREIMFIHPRAVEKFSGWESFANSPSPSVRQFLQQAA